MKKVLLFLNKYKVLLLVLLIGVGLDLFSKWHVFENILDITSEDIHNAVEKSSTNPGKYLNNARIEISEDRLYFTSVLNPGAFSGFLGGNMTLLVILSFIAIFFLFWLFFKSTELTFKMQFLAGLIFAGAIGNMYDRIVFRCVRDFAEFRLPEIDIKFLNPWNTFNVADTFISIGVFTFVAIMIFSGAMRKKHEGKGDDTNSDLESIELEKIDEDFNEEPIDDKFLVVFSECKEFEIDDFVKPFADLMQLHVIDSKRLLRKQQGFINLFLTQEKAEEVKNLFSAKISDLKIVKAADFPRLPGAREIYYLDMSDEGLIIGSEKSKGEQPVPWSDITNVAAAFIPGRDDPILKEIKDRLAKSAILQLEGISKNEKMKIFADIIGSIEKIALWQESLDKWLKIMDAETLKEKVSEFPQLLVDIFMKSGEHYRVNSKSLIFSMLGEKRTPNQLYNTRLLLSQITKKLNETQTSPTIKSLVLAEDGEFHSIVIENMFFEFVADFENYLRWVNFTSEQEPKT